MPDWRAFVRERAGAADDQVLDEIGEHAAELYRSLRSEGRSHAEALAAVESELRAADGLLRTRMSARRRQTPTHAGPRGSAGLRWPLLRDFSYAARMFAARPAFAAVAVLTLALGIGANTAIFSIVHALLLAPLPYPGSERLVMMWECASDDRANRFIVSAPNWLAWRASSSSFEHAALWEYRTYNVSGGAEPQQVPGLRVSASLFPMLGVAPQFGRTFTEAEDAPGHRVAVIAHTMWQQRFGGRPDIIGQTFSLDGEAYEIVGVMPASFQFTQRRFAVWVPLALNRTDRYRDSHSFFAAARLKAGVSFEAARDEIEAIGRRLEQQHEANRGEGATITRMSEYGVTSLRPTLTALSAAVAVVLLIACVNLANLLLAQATTRHREFAIRAALGAGRGRLGAQLFAEAALLAVLGGGLGLFLAWAGTAALGESLPASIRMAPFRTAGVVSINAPVLAFTGVLALFTAVLFSFAPIAGIAGTAPAASLRSSGARGATSRFTLLRSTLIAVELALAVTVLAAAGLMIKSVAKLLAVDAGVDPRGVVLLDVALPQADLYGPPARASFCGDVDREVGAVAGVTAVGATSHVPLDGGNATRGFSIQGRPPAKPGQGAGASYRLTCPGYFKALGIRVLRGRDFTRADSRNAPGVAIVNEVTALRYWPGEDPVGTRMKLGAADSPDPWLTVVGVVAGVRHNGLDDEPPRELYLPYSQAAWPVMTITAKTAAAPMALAPSIKAAIARIDPALPVSRVRTMETVVLDSVGGRRFPMLLLGIFSAVALTLAAVGVYGVVSFVVSQRTREIGIRIALGAGRGSIVRWILARSLVPTVLGLAAGVAGALGTSKLLAQLLFQVRPGDGSVLMAIVVLLGGVALTASWLPARRSAAVDPLIVLKDE
jgi:putative ABC transport system permease protein